mmetsp:Transcript_72185/g.208969  ORF Transcript_72185/g.208969 Transcript_72185/m.208969 type:complete len:305 (-) Transcript_72185:232-1146(-)
MGRCGGLGRLRLPLLQPGAYPVVFGGRPFDVRRQSRQLPHLCLRRQRLQREQVLCVVHRLEPRGVDHALLVLLLLLPLLPRGPVQAGVRRLRHRQRGQGQHEGPVPHRQAGRQCACGVARRRRWWGRRGLEQRKGEDQGRLGPRRGRDAEVVRQDQGQGRGRRRFQRGAGRRACRGVGQGLGRGGPPRRERRRPRRDPGRRRRQPHGRRGRLREVGQDREERRIDPGGQPGLQTQRECGILLQHHGHVDPVADPRRRHGDGGHVRPAARDLHHQGGELRPASPRRVDGRVALAPEGGGARRGLR